MLWHPGSLASSPTGREVREGQPATAEGMLRQGIQYDPNNRTAHYTLGQLLQQLGRVEEAKREFEITERLQSSGR